jgi:branched-chain amino acid transport system permease protein
MDWVKERQAQVITAGVIALLVVILLATGEKDSLVIGVITGSAYGFLALGLVLIYKSSGVFNFAQGEFGTVAVFTLYLLHFHVPYGIAILGALVVAVIMGVVVERIIVRPLFDAPRVTLLVATAGVALLSVGVQIWFGEATAKSVDRALPTLDRVTVLGVQVSDQRLLLLGALAILAALLAFFFNKTNLGLAILGSSQEPTATELMGISVKRLSTIVWAMAALLGGLAGVLAVPESGSVSPGVLTGAFLIPAFTAAVLGGMTSLPGAFLGGIVVGIVEAVGTSAPIFQDGGALEIPGNPSTLLVFVVLLVVLIARPQGLLGKAG